MPWASAANRRHWRSAASCWRCCCCSCRSALLSVLKLALRTLDSVPKPSWGSSTSMGLTCVIRIDGDLNVSAALIVGTRALDSVLPGPNVVPVGAGSVSRSLSSSSSRATIAACCSMTSAISGRMPSPLLSLDTAGGVCEASRVLRRLAIDAAAALWAALAYSTPLFGLITC